MTSLEKYNKAFCDSFEITEDMLQNLKYQQIDQWDSIGHMVLVANIEDAFGITMLPDDVIELSSYEKGKEILVSSYNVVF